MSQYRQEQKRYSTNMRMARLLVGYTQDALAARIGVDPAIIGRIERGIIRGTQEQRRRLARILEVPESLLFPEDKEHGIKKEGEGKA